MIFAKETKFEKTFYAVCSMLCFSTVALLVCAQVFNLIKFYAATIISFGGALLLFIIWFRYKYKQCNVLVNAKLKDIKRRTRYLSTYYLTLFQFEYNGKKYECYDMLSRDKKTIKKHFQIGDYYDIFINPKDPSTYCTYKRVKSYSHIAIYIVALIIILFGIYAVMAI